MDTELRWINEGVQFNFERGAVAQGRVQALGIVVLVLVFSLPSANATRVTACPS